MKISKEDIIATTIDLIIEKEEDVSSVTIREICNKLGISTGLINYHFKSKDALLAVCVERLIERIVNHFTKIKDSLNHLNTEEKVFYLSELTFDYLFDHPNISKMSIRYDANNPSSFDNTSMTIKAYLPLLREYKPELKDLEVYFLAYRLIFLMQESFNRAKVIKDETGIDLYVKDQRSYYHREMLKEILK